MKRVVLAMLLATGCSETMVQTKVAVPSFEQSKEAATISRPKVSVIVEPLGYAELENGKVPKIKASWGEVDRAQARMGGGAGTSKQRYEELALIPVPSFAVAIVNDSAMPIAFKDARVRIESKSGKSYKAILAPEDVASRVDVLTRERFPSAGQQNQLLEQLRDAVMRVPLLSTETKLAAGERFDGVLVVDFGSYNLQELDKVLAADDSYSLVFENVGGESQPLSIKIAMNKIQKTITAQCPEGKPATAQSCKLGD
jgi:hypothetical protein